MSNALTLEICCRVGFWLTDGSSCQRCLVTLQCNSVFQHSSVSDYSPADGYAFNNSMYNRGPHLDQGEAAGAFKSTPNRHGDR